MEAAELTRRDSLKMNLTNLLKAEEISWKQKFRERWLQEGDKNIKYFHALTSHRRRSNYISELWVVD